MLLPFSVDHVSAVGLIYLYTNLLMHLSLYLHAVGGSNVSQTPHLTSHRTLGTWRGR